MDESHDIDIIKLREMKYSELRAHAKKFNIKGNLKANKLIDAILEKANQQNSDNNSSLDNTRMLSISEQPPMLPGDTPKTPAAVSKARRRTYELTPETTLVLDVDTAKDVAKINSITTAPITKPDKEKVMNTRSKIPVQEHKRTRICATPNFRRLHEKAFEKMDSLDVYVAKKAARVEKHRSHQQSVKSVRSLGLKFAKQSPAVKHSNVFKPTVISTSTMNLNFAPVLRTTRATQSKIPTVSGKMPFRFVGDSTLKNVRTPLKNIVVPPAKFTNNRTPLKNVVVPTIKTITKPTFRYQPPKRQEKNAVKEVVHTTRQPVRENARNMLKGVRLNKRFELQLQARGIALHK